MPLSPYHQQYADQTNEQIADKAAEKRRELEAIFAEVSLNVKSDPIKIAVLGCGDKRLVGHHREIFKDILQKKVEVNTFDITIDHLDGEENVFAHDATLPLPEGPYDIVYSHVLLKFIPVDKQFDVIMNSYDALNIGGVAIHICDSEEIDAPPEEFDGSKIDGHPVPLSMYKMWLNDSKIKYQEIPLKYGVALVIVKY